MDTIQEFQDAGKIDSRHNANLVTLIPKEEYVIFFLENMLDETRYMFKNILLFVII